MTPIQTTRAFQTSDTRTHATRTEAIDHQLKIDVRGLLQSAFPGIRTDGFTSTQLAEALVKNKDGFVNLINSYNKAMTRALVAEKLTKTGN